MFWKNYKLRYLNFHAKNIFKNLKQNTEKNKNNYSGLRFYDLLLQVLMKNYTCSRTKLTPLPVYTMICTRKCTRLTKHERTTWWFMDYDQIFFLKSSHNWKLKSTRFSSTIYNCLGKFKRPKLLAYWPAQKYEDVVQSSSILPTSGTYYFYLGTYFSKIIHLCPISGTVKKSSQNPSYSEVQTFTSPKTCLEKSESTATNWPSSWERLVSITKWTPNVLIDNFHLLQIY